MEIIGVIDLRGGTAVHAVGGDRRRYAPVMTAAGEEVDGDPVALARAYVDHLGLRELYVADLDAIGEGRPQGDAVERLVATGAALWLDAGVASAGDAMRVASPGVAHVIVGLETLASWNELSRICASCGAGTTVFSLDLRQSVPIGPLAAGATPGEIACRAQDAGIQTIIVLDLARVGTGKGLDLEQLAGVREVVPGMRLVAGGGVRDGRDLDRLAGIGCDAALVATALHDGRIGRAEIAASRERYRNVSR